MATLSLAKSDPAKELSTWCRNTGFYAKVTNSEKTDDATITGLAEGVP
jgi:hypothetical protein